MPDWDSIADGADTTFEAFAAAVQGHVERGTLRSIACVFEFDEGDGNTNVMVYGGKSTYIQMLGLTKYLNIVVDSEYIRGEIGKE